MSAQPTNIPGLTFDEDAHLYYYEGARVPGVSSIIQPLQDLSHINDDVLERKSQLGTAVHLCTEFYDHNDLDESTVLPEWMPYLNAWAEFRRVEKFEPLLIEAFIFHPKLRYAGKLDRFGLFGGQPCVIDIKTVVQMGPHIGVQLAGYEKALAANPPAEIQELQVAWNDLLRIGLQLRKDGTYKFWPYRDPNDGATFVSLLNVMAWRQRHAA